LENKVLCKYKLALLKGNRKMLCDPVEENLLQQVLSSSVYLALKPSIEKYEQDSADVEREMAQIKGREKSIKAAFAYEIAQGRKRQEKNLLKA